MCLFSNPHGLLRYVVLSPQSATLGEFSNRQISREEFDRGRVSTEGKPGTVAGLSFFGTFHTGLQPKADGEISLARCLAPAFPHTSGPTPLRNSLVVAYVIFAVLPLAPLSLLVSFSSKAQDACW